MARQILIFSTLLACLCFHVEAGAQGPAFQPYGAWRGRIRYVEGPHRTKQRIHWGSGITPTGGQVLMHGLSVAGDVFTNPDFLSKLAPRSPDEQTRIGDEWNAIKKKDQEMLDELNKLRRSIQPGRADLTFADELSSNVGSSSNDSAGGGEPDQKAYENITNELSKSVDSLKAARKKLQTSIDNYAAKVKEDSFFGQLVKKAASIPTADVRQAEIKVPSTWGTQEPSTDSPESQEFTKALKEFDSAIQQCEALFTKHSSNPGLKKDLETGEEAIMRLKKNVEYGRAQHTALTSPTTPPRVP